MGGETINTHGGTSETSRSWRWIQYLSLMAFPLAFWGAPEHHWDSLQWWWDTAYETLQSFVLHAPHLPHPPSWPTRAARLLAALGTIAFTFDFLLRGGLLPRDPLRARKRPVVAVGNGPLARQVVHHLAERHHPVVAVASDATPAHPGMPVAVLSALEAVPVDRVMAAMPDRVLLVDQDDARNVDAAIRLHAWVSMRHRPMTSSCLVHVVDPELRRQLFELGLFRTAVSGMRFTLGDVYGSCARTVLGRHPLDHRPIALNSTLTARVVVVGFGRLGEAFALQAARVGTFASLVPPEIVVVDADPDRAVASLLYRWPAFDSVTAVTKVRCVQRVAEFTERVEPLLREANRVTTVVLAAPDDALNVTLALALHAAAKRHRARLLVRLSSERGLPAVLRSPDLVASGVVHPFTTVDEGTVDDLLGMGRLDALAGVVHEDFRRRRIAEGRSSEDPSVAPWEALAPGLQDSNRQQADHIPIKLRAVGLHEGASGARVLQQFTGFSDDEVEQLAVVEHARWVTERRLDGWTLGPADKPARVSPYLVPWSGLPDEVKEWDREAVRNIPALLAEARSVWSR
jgi:hypothetical protein